MKKLLVILLAVSLLAVCAVSVNAADATGQCGDNLTWTLDGYTLTISGTGPMYDYSEENPAPWVEFKGQFVYVKIEEGATSIGAYAFAEISRLYSVYIPASVTNIGSKAFSASSSLTDDIYLMGSMLTIAEDAFAGRTAKVGYLYENEELTHRDYGGSLTWFKGGLRLADNVKKLYQLNEDVKPEDFVVIADYNSIALSSVKYTPREITVGSFDNSTYGQKNVEVTVDGYKLKYDYFVTDGQNHLDLIKVGFPAYTYYDYYFKGVDPVVTAGTISLENGTHYNVTYESEKKAGSYVQATVTGRGIYEGYEGTFSYAIVKRDIADAHIYVSEAAFMGEPVTPEVTVKIEGTKLTAGRDFVLIFENNVNIGTGTVRIVGKGNYCGTVVKNFEIVNGETKVTLPGTNNGVATGQLTGDPYYSEGIVSPGTFIGRVDSDMNHAVYYELYRINGEEAELITTKETDYGAKDKTQFVYDFTSAYHDAAEVGGEIYMLVYLWVDARERVYTGVYVMYIPAKVPDATTMVVEQVTGISDFRRVYMSAYGTDGNVGDITWTTSNPSVATVKDGVVTLKAPGTVTITGQYGNLTDAQEITVTAQDLTQGDVLCYDAQTGAAAVFYDGWLLTAGTDYSLLVSEQEGVTVVTVVGRGLFTGQLVRQFDTASADPLGHTHSFENCEDTICGTCTFERAVAHQYSEQWQKNQTHHWHACTACGEKADQAQHSLSAGDETVCNICGPLYTPGDLTGDYSVNEDDAIYLLQHILLPDFFTVNQAVDYTGDNRVDEDDAIYLLQHVLLPEFFPL